MKLLEVYEERMYLLFKNDIITLFFYFFVNA